MKYPKIETPKMACQTSIISETSPLITLPFPPIIRASDIVNKRKPCRVKSKSPNAFLIYRRAFLDQLSLLNHSLRMTDVSKLVSNYWKNETEIVKDAYRKISREVEVELSEKRKECVSYRVVWKNSKYSKYSDTRKRNQLGKMIKTKGNKSESKAKFKATNVSSKCGNVFYQFVPAFPNIESTSSNIPKECGNNKEIISTSDLETVCNSPETSQNSEEYSEHSECSEFNNEFTNNYQGPNDNNNLAYNQSYLQFAQNSTNFNNQLSNSFIEQRGHLIFDEHIQKNINNNGGFYELELDWYLQNFM